MILRKNVHHPNDVSIKYLQATQAKELFDYFKLPGKFVRSYPRKIVKRDGSEREMDWLILVNPDHITIFERTLINVEFQSRRVDEKKIKAMSDYKDYSKTYFGLPVLSIVIIFDETEFKSSLKEYSTTASDILRPIYIHMPGEEIKKRLNNLEIKIHNKEKLSPQESFDIAFLPMFAPRLESETITEKITRLFRADRTIEDALRNDVAYVLGIMIRKYFDATKKGKELLKLIEKEINKTDLMEVIEYELNYREQAHKAELQKIINEKNNELTAKNNEINEKNNELTAKNNEINEKNKENARLKAKLKENGIEF